MSVVVYIDPARLQPVFNDAWHRVVRLDFSRGTLTTLCGQTEDIDMSRPTIALAA
jgi:hypothetical protein